MVPDLDPFLIQHLKNGMATVDLKNTSSLNDYYTSAESDKKIFYII